MFPNWFNLILSVTILIIFLITFLINYFVFSSKLKWSHILVPMHILLVLFKYISCMRTFVTICNNYFPLIILNAKIFLFFFLKLLNFSSEKFIWSIFFPTVTTHRLLLSFHHSYLTSPTFRIGVCKIVLFRKMF